MNPFGHKELLISLNLDNEHLYFQMPLTPPQSILLRQWRLIRKVEPRKFCAYAEHRQEQGTV